MVYNLTNISSASNLLDFTYEVNTLVNGAYAILFLLVFFFMVMIAMRNYDFFSTLLVSSSITILIAAFFIFLNLISWSVFSVILVILIASLIITIWRG